MPTEQKLWKVQVLCEGIVPTLVGAKTKKPIERLERRYKTVLLLASGGAEAMELAKSYADSHADSDVNWKLFTPLNAAHFVLPIELGDL